MIQFVELDQSKYDALATKEADAIYFTKDTNRIYKGNVCYTPTTVIDTATLDSATKKSLVGLMMPSDSYTDIPISSGNGTNTTTITAQADGYIAVRGISCSANASVELSTLQGTSDYGLSDVSKAVNLNELIAFNLPVRSGASVKVIVTNCNVNHLRLYPAVGSL